jgi:hypothetical protein
LKVEDTVMSAPDLTVHQEALGLRVVGSPCALELPLVFGCTDEGDLIVVATPGTSTCRSFRIEKIDGTASV